MIARLTILVALLGSAVLASSPITRAGLRADDDFHLKVTIVTGEHSRDSNSTTRTLSVAANELLYEESYAGAHSGQRRPIKKRFKLNQQDQSDLVAILKEKHLVVTKTISIPPLHIGATRYFELAIVTALQAQEYTVTIEASPAAENLKSDPLYQGSVDLIEQLYKIINRTDKDLTPPRLID